MYSDKIDKTPTCHIWTGATVQGYGVVMIEGHMKRVHRLIWEVERGKIPQGLVINHLCRVRNCVNVQHLEVTTHKHNILTGISPSAINAKKTHCPQGHRYTKANTYFIKSTGWRSCRECHKLNSRKYRMAKHD